jgi:hypothetical protein
MGGPADGDAEAPSGWVGVELYASCKSLDGSKGAKVKAPASSDEVGLKRRGSIWLTSIFYVLPGQ